MVVLVMAALSVPPAAKQDGGGPPEGDAVTLHLSGTTREMGMKYGQYASDAISPNFDQLSA